MSAPSPARDARGARSPATVTPDAATTSRAAADDDDARRTPSPRVVATTLATSFDAMTLRDRANDGATTRDATRAKRSSFAAKR